MKLDILAFGAHPDDVELGASGTLIKHIKLGYKVGIIDLTAGELGSRGSVETRYNESEKSKELMGAAARENLLMADGFFEHSRENLLKVVKTIRKFQPSIILANAVNDRHPDHGKGAKLVSEAAFLSGLVKIKTTLNGKTQEAFRPNQVFHYIQDHHLEPDFVVNIDSEMDLKMKCIEAYASQFYSENNNSKEPTTPISSKEFYDFLIGRAREFGRISKCEFGEGFTNNQALSVNSLFDLK